MNFNSDDVECSSKSQMLCLNRKLLTPSFCSKTITKALLLWRFFFFLGAVYVLISWKQTDAIERVMFGTEVVFKTHLVTFQNYQVSVGRRRRMGLLRGVLYSSVTRVSKPRIQAIRCCLCRVVMIILYKLLCPHAYCRDISTFQTLLCICIGFVTRVNALHKMKKKT